MKFLELSEVEWIKLDSIDAFWLTDMDYNHMNALNYGIEFKVNGCDDHSIWLNSEEERDAIVTKLKHYFGGWL